MTALKRLVVPALLVLALAGCGPSGPILEGSLGQYYDLGFQKTEAALFSSELAIEYISKSNEKIAIVTVRTTDANLDGPATVDLAKYGDVTGSSAGQAMPALDTGTLILRSYQPKAGAKVTGEFNAQLKGSQGDVSLHGTFDTTLLDQR